MINDTVIDQKPEITLLRVTLDDQLSFLLMLKLNDNLFCNDNIVIFVFFLQFPSLLL